MIVGDYNAIFFWIGLASSDYTMEVDVSFLINVEIVGIS